jgi:flagellar basal body rod protein FlgB
MSAVTNANLANLHTQHYVCKRKEKKFAELFKENLELKKQLGDKCRKLAEAEASLKRFVASVSGGPWDDHQRM